MKVRCINIKTIVCIMLFLALVIIGSNSLAVITIQDTNPGTTLSFNKGGRIDPWSGKWELLPYNVTRETPVGATFCMQKHQALRFTPTQVGELKDYKTETIVAHTVLHSYGEHDVPDTYARSAAEELIKNEINGKLDDLGWGAAEVGTGDMAEYGISNYDYTAIDASGDVVAVSKAYSKTPNYVGQGKEKAENDYVSYILSSGSYFNPITRFGLKKGNYAGSVSDTASGEGNAFLIQDSIWASKFNLPASNGINYRRTFPKIAVELVKEAEEYENYVPTLNSYSASFEKTEPKVIANRQDNTYTVGPLKIDYPDDTRFSFIQDIYLVDENGNKIETEFLKIHTASGKDYPTNGETFFIEFPGSVGEAHDRINIKAEFAYLKLTYAEYERFTGAGDIGQMLGILDTTSDTHEYKDPVYHEAEYDENGNLIKEAYYEHFYCTRYFLTGRFEEKIVGHYDSQSLFDVITVKREWVEDYSSNYAEKDKLIELTTSLGGFVWVDEEQGKQTDFNGIYDSNEKKVPNIVVKLFNKNGKLIKETKTDENGEYKFKNLNALKKYYVTFEYNGQYFEPTTYTSPYDTTNGWGRGTWQTNSNATDIVSEREAFNNRFAVIGSNPANYDGNKTTYTKMELLGYTLNENGVYVKTTDATIDEFGNLIKEDSVMAQYVKDSKMTAHTGLDTNYDYYPTPDIYLIDNKPVIKNTFGSMYNMKEKASKIEIIFPDAYFINLGLHRREVTDIAVNKDIDKVTVEINNQVHEYTYDTRNMITCNGCGFTAPIEQFERYRTDDYRWHVRCPKCKSEDLRPNWDITIRLSDGYYDKIYSRSIYKTDYAYRVTDYGEDYAKYGVDESTELQVYVTYKVAVSNQSLSNRTRIDELVDYYDNNYELVPERSYIEITEGENAGKYIALFSDTSTCGDNNDKITGLKKTYIRGIGKDDANIYLDAGQYANFYVTFRVAKKDGHIILDEDDNGNLLEGKENIVELNGYATRYKKGIIIPNIYDGIDGRPDGVPNDETNAGIVDINSNPGNQTSRTDIRENDADKAPRMRIILDKNDQGRIIEGTVWEDNRTNEIGSSIIADGLMTDDETRINGVTVQLVEIMANPTDEEHREFVWREFGSDITGNGTIGTGVGSGGTATEKPIINYKNLISDYVFDGDYTGKYAFKSFIPGNYVVRFIYGDTVKTVVPASLGGSNAKSYNGQDYKSTIYQKGISQDTSYEWRTNHTFVNGIEVPGELLTVVSALKNDASNNETTIVPIRNNVPNWTPISVENQNGYLYSMENSKVIANVSDAKDIESRRNEVIDYSDDNVINQIAEVLASHKEDNQLGLSERSALLTTLIDKTKMNAETGLMVVGIEYGESEKTPNSYVIDNVNFGLQERPKSKLEIQKEVSNLKVVLANGSILFDAKQAEPNVLWTDVLIQVTMDEEIMHGASIILDYDITVNNVGEVDYNDNVFYYTGELSENVKKNNVVTTTPCNVIDYVANNLQFSAEENGAWKEISKDEIKQLGLIKKSLINDGKINQNNTIIISDAFGKELAPTRYQEEINGYAQNSTTVPLVLSQLITSQNSTDDLTYRNMVEIVRTANTVGRRDDVSIVGNQDPTNNVPQEPDTDVAQVVRVLPPFGDMSKTTVIAITIIVSIIILATSIIIIKKKVL